MSISDFFAGKNFQYTGTQKSLLVILRIMIGWHFLYEGIIKILNPGWSSIAYLLDSEGLFSGLFESMAANAGIVEVIDFMNIWGLTFIGLGLILGAFTQLASIAGVVLLLFYYLSHPPLIGVEYAIPSEGNYMFVNKTLIEMITLLVLYYFPTGRLIGLDRLIFKEKK